MTGQEAWEIIAPVISNYLVADSKSPWSKESDKKRKAILIASKIIFESLLITDELYRNRRDAPKEGDIE